MGRKKITTEIGYEPKIVEEEKAIKEKPKKYSNVNLLKALEDISYEVNNAFFRLPYNRCPDCNKGRNAVMAHFGYSKKNTIGNLKGFMATTGDIIAWYSNTYRGLDFVIGKSNGVFELENETFVEARKEPTVVDKLVIPSKYMELAKEMALFLEYPFTADENDLVKIGNGFYPHDIKEKL